MGKGFIELYILNNKKDLKELIRINRLNKKYDMDVIEMFNEKKFKYKTPSSYIKFNFDVQIASVLRKGFEAEIGREMEYDLQKYILKTFFNAFIKNKKRELKSPL